MRRNGGWMLKMKLMLMTSHVARIMQLVLGGVHPCTFEIRYPTSKACQHTWGWSLQGRNPFRHLWDLFLRIQYLDVFVLLTCCQTLHLRCLVAAVQCVDDYRKCYSCQHSRLGKVLEFQANIELRLCIILLEAEMYIAERVAEQVRKSRFRDLQRQLHPDKNADIEEADRSWESKSIDYI